MRINGIRFNGKHSFDDYGMYIAKRPDTGIPAPKTIFTEIAGMDGGIDQTESVTGEVKYSNRTCVFEFSAMVDVQDQSDFMGRIMDDIHGKSVEVELDEDAGWIYKGRATVKFTNVESWKLHIVITIDADPYKMADKEDEIAINASNWDLVIVDIAGRNVSRQDWNTDLRFDEANGNWGLYNAINITWNPNTSPHFGDRVLIQVVDAKGHVANVKFAGEDWSFTDGAAVIFANQLTGAGLDRAKIRRLLLSGVGIAKVDAFIHNGFSTVIENDRLTVVPRFEVGINSGVYIVVNGKMHFLPNGSYRDPEITFTQGKNNVVFSPVIESEHGTIKMAFRRGRL